MHLITEVQFQQLRERYARCDPQDLDPRIIPTLIALNKIPGVVTIFSCSGHTFVELENNPELCSDQKTDIIIGITEEGLDFIRIAQLWLAELNFNAWATYRPNIKMLRLIYPLQGYRNLYSAWMIQMNLNGKQLGEYGFTDMEQWQSLINFYQMRKAAEQT